MDASRAAAPNHPGAAGARILVLGADLESIAPVVDRLERWGAGPLVLFDVPAALNALARSRPYLVVLDSRFGPDRAGLLAALQGDRALPVDARRPVPTLVLTGPGDPPLDTVLGPELARRVSTVPRDQPAALDSALRQALQRAGLSSYAPQAFGAPPLEPLAPLGQPPLGQPAPAPSAPVTPAAPAAPPIVSRGAPTTARPTPAARQRVPVGRLTLAAALLLALLGIPYLITNRPGSRPETQPADATRTTSPGSAGSPSAAASAAAQATAPATPPLPGQPSQAGPSTQPGQGQPPGQAAAPGQPGQPGQPQPNGSILDPLIGLLGPLVGAPPPGANVPPGAQPGAQPGAGGASLAPGIQSGGDRGPATGPAAPGAAPGAPAVRPPWQPPQAPRIPFCGDVERWRQPVRDVLSEAWNEGRLDGPAGALDDDLLLALILRESTGDPLAIGTGGKGEVGLLQLLPATFSEQVGLPIGPTGPNADSLSSLIQAMQDPRLNLRAGVRYLARAFAAQGGDLYWSLVAYRTGLEGAAAWRRAGGTPAEIDARVRATLETYARHRPDVRLVFVPSPGAPAPLAIKPILPAGTC
ncbi:MAG TPA: transglycosylase SLT domain-containing protein [Chloroflexota bacterium]|nr:transglycosylase SLT domain-containing protein [Chloroflexota bacterium]